MNYETFLLKDYIINASDLKYLVKTNVFKELEKKIKTNKINIENTKIHSSITNEEHLILLLDQYIYLIKKNVYIDPVEIRYLIESSIKNEKNSIFLHCDYFLDKKDYYISKFKELFMHNFTVNYEKLKENVNNQLVINNFNDLCNLINNNKEIYYVLFDNISDNNFDKYTAMWNKLII